jgi:DNA-binding protein Fis
MCDSNISTQQEELYKILKYFIDRGCTCKQMKNLIDEILTYKAMEKFKGNQSKAAKSLGISRGTFRKILLRLESEGKNECAK